MFLGTRNLMVTFSKVSSKQGCQNQPGSVARLQFFSLKSSKNEYQLLKSVPFRFFRTIKLLVPFLKAIDKQGCQILLTGLPDPHFSPKNAKNWSNLQKNVPKKFFGARNSLLAFSKVIERQGCQILHGSIAR